MNQDLVNTIVNVASVAGPAVVAFLVGHFHVLTKNPAAPNTPANPATPANPNVTLPIGQGGILQMLGLLNAALPHADPTKPLAPIGQGGLIQLISLTLQGIMSNPTATPQQKASAASQVVEATAPFTVDKEAPVAKV